MIKAIIFDCFGVLTTDTWHVFLDGLPADIDLEAARNVHRAYDAGRLSKRESSKQIHAITGRTFTELEDLLDAKVVKNKTLLNFIRELRKNYKVGLLSNIGNDWITTEFLTLKEQQLFDAMVFSFEVGMVKPEPRMFTLMCERLGVEPGEAVMIDDVDRFCTAARDLGMQAIEYKDFNQMKRELEEILKQ